ncbi:MAG: hypothetical protein D6732_11460 [Methanobacteriota archaeon]|nr:MAG: hypothetical protein D6732_11460 [Euryarchaeota archaeon]
MSETNFDIFASETAGLKKSRIRTKLTAINPKAKFAVYVTKSDENSAFRLPFIIISLGLLFSFFGTLFSSPSRSLLVSLQDFISFASPSFYPLLGVASFLFFIYLENFEELNFTVILIAWFLSGFITGMVNGPTRSEGILIQLLRAVARMIGIVVLAVFFVGLFLFKTSDIFTGFGDDVAFAFAFLFSIAFALLLLIPISFIAAFGFTVGERFNNE